MTNWTAKKQTAAGTHQGKWVVYRPDGIRFVPCETRLLAMQLAAMLRVATTAKGGDWQGMLEEVRREWIPYSTRVKAQAKAKAKPKAAPNPTPQPPPQPPPKAPSSAGPAPGMVRFNIKSPDGAAGFLAYCCQETFRGADILRYPVTFQKAYREAARRHHPDKGGDAEQMKNINIAAQTLKERHGL